MKLPSLHRFAAAIAFWPLTTAAAEENSARLQFEFDTAVRSGDDVSVAAKGRQLLALLESQQSFKAASDVALKTAFAADRTGRPDDAVAAAMDAIRIIEIRCGPNMRAWDWTLLSQMAGVAVKNHIAAGRLATAGFMQHEAWRHIGKAVTMETGLPWKPAMPLPSSLSQGTMDILLRTARIELPLLSALGRNLESVERAKSLDAALRQRAHGEGSHYHLQILNELAGELKFLGHWRSALATLDRVIALAPEDSNSNFAARFNKAYWRSQFEGPDPALLAEARELVAQMSERSYKAGERATRRLLAKMAFAYREAGFDVGDLDDLIREALNSGALLEAIYARRDLGVIQRESADFVESENNLIATLTSLRAVGKKSGEPTAYREYGRLLLESGRPREAMLMLREAIRQTKSFRWTQHLPPLLHLLGKAQAAAGDAPGLRRTLAELEALLASGKLEPERRVDALVATARCRKALGDSDGAQKTLTKAVADAKRSKVSAWLTTWAEKFPLESVKLVTSAAGTAPTGVEPAADLQPVSIASDVIPGENARVRFTLSNPAPVSATGTLVLKGAHLTAAWDAIAAEGRIRILPDGGESELRHSLTLEAGEEWLIIGDAAGRGDAKLDLEWLPASGPAQPVQWTITRHEPDAVDVAITNASLAGRNPFYALRLHHAFSRRRGDDRQPVGFRILASRPLRLEMLDPETGALLAADSNGDGDFTDAGDLLISDQDHDGFPDLPVSAAGPAEIAVLAYPSTGDASSRPSAKRDEITLDVQVKDTTGWESAARDILK